MVGRVDLAAVLAGTNAAPLAVDAEDLSATVSALISDASMNTDTAPAALLALRAPALVHADAAPAAPVSYTHLTLPTKA